MQPPVLSTSAPEHQLHGGSLSNVMKQHSTPFITAAGSPAGAGQGSYVGFLIQLQGAPLRLSASQGAR